MEIKTDILVIGSGIAGLFYALKVSEFASVAIITKKEKAESNTNYAQGGIASVISSEDSFELHIQDTLNVGGGLCHRDVVELMVKEGPERISELVEIGVQFTRKQNQFDISREGGHSRNRILHAADLTGKEIERALLEKISKQNNITMFENHFAIDLITEHQLEKKTSSDERKHCYGAYVLDEDENTVRTFLANVTMLSTGGAGQVYLHTTNPNIATGDGFAMAYRAGAMLANMEFIQFHPTTLYQSGSPAYLISEAVRGAGGILRTKNGEAFMKKYDERESLAPRDIVVRAIDSELKKSGDEFVELDVTHLLSEKIKEHFPNIYKTCLEKFKLDITKEKIPVVPAAHYVCGGVVTDVFGKTSIENLFACGEIAMTGVHGANRLASNSLLEAVVFSHRASIETKKTLQQTFEKISVPQWDDSGTMNNEEWILIEHNKKEIQQTMWDYGGIVRSDLRLQRALRRIEFLREEITEFYRRTKVSEGLIELRNLVLVAELIVRSALQRKESRGLHYTTDFPQTNDAMFGDTIIFKKE